MRLLWRRGARLLSRPITANYYGRRLLLPRGHDLVLLSNDLPLFNTPLRRLAAVVREDERSLRLVDVGANVGEVLALVEPRLDDRFWLVEGSRTFLPFLYQNAAAVRDVVVLPVYLGDEPGLVRGGEVVVAGNAHLSDEGGAEVEMETLDRLFPHPSNVEPNLLKIDVEGHEPKVFAGGRSFLRRAQPIVFAEWHPRLLRREGAAADAVVASLREAEYDRMLVYDNHGFLLGEFGLGDSAHVRALADYARARDAFYFDLAVFAPAHARLLEKFAASERAFYAAAG